MTFSSQRDRHHLGQAADWGLRTSRIFMAHIASFLLFQENQNPLTKLIIPPKKQLLSSPTLKDFTLLWADKYELCLNFRSWKFSLVCIGCSQEDFRQVFWCCGHSSAQPAGLNHDGKGTYAKVVNSPVGRSSHPKRKLKVRVW